MQTISIKIAAVEEERGRGHRVDRLERDRAFVVDAGPPANFGRRLGGIVAAHNCYCSWLRDASVASGAAFLAPLPAELSVSATSRTRHKRSYTAQGDCQRHSHALCGRIRLDRAPLKTRGLLSCCCSAGSCSSAQRRPCCTLAHGAPLPSGIVNVRCSIIIDAAIVLQPQMNDDKAPTPPDRDRAAILAARKERKAAAKAAKRTRARRDPRRGPSRKGCGVPPAVVDAIDALELAPVSVEVAPHAAAARAFTAATAKHRRTFQTTNRATHQLQIESLRRCVERRGLLADHRIVELGAGKGLLGGVLAALSDTKAVALDRRRAPTTTYNDAHIVADVEKCDIEAVVGATSGEKILLLAKHLCGSASDAAVRAGRQARAYAASLVLAPCRHPQIAWETYAGRAWLEGHGIGEEAFSVLRDVVRATRAPRPEDRLFCGPATAARSTRERAAASASWRGARSRKVGGARIDGAAAVQVVRARRRLRSRLIGLYSSRPRRRRHRGRPPTFVVDDALTGCAPTRTRV